MDADIKATGVARATGRNDAGDSPESVLIGATVSENHALARQAGPVARLAGLAAGVLLPDMLIVHGALDPYIGAGQWRRLHGAVAAFDTASQLNLDILLEGTHGGGEFEWPQTMGKGVAFLNSSFASSGRRKV